MRTKGNEVSITHKGCGGNAVAYPDANGPLVCVECGTNLNVNSQLNVSQNPN